LGKKKKKKEKERKENFFDQITGTLKIKHFINEQFTSNVLPHIRVQYLQNDVSEGVPDR
jgi:hypothetical protein